jgi:large subunit ribosomal protein L30
MESFIRVTLETGVIGTPERQKKTVLGLGLKYRQASRVLKDTPAIRGMAQAVRHLVRIEKVGQEQPSSFDPFGGVKEYELGEVKVAKPKERKKIAAPSSTPAKEEVIEAKAKKAEHPSKKKAPLSAKKEKTKHHAEKAEKSKPVKKTTEKVTKKAKGKGK